MDIEKKLILSNKAPHRDASGKFFSLHSLTVVLFTDTTCHLIPDRLGLEMQRVSSPKYFFSSFLTTNFFTIAVYATAMVPSHRTRMQKVHSKNMR